VEQDNITALELLNIPLSTRTGAAREQTESDWASKTEIRRFVTDIRWNDLVGAAIDDPERRQSFVFVCRLHVPAAHSASHQTN